MNSTAPQERTTVLALLEERARAQGEGIALAPLDAAPITSRSLATRVAALAAALQERGVRTNAQADRVAIVLPNGPQLSLALLASCVAGVAVPLNPAYRAEEFQAYFLHAGCRFLLCGPDDSGPAIPAATAAGLRVLRLGVDLMSLDNDPPVPMAPLRPPQADDLAVVMLTSGSTGRGKIVPLTHRNLCRSALDVGRSVALDGQDRCLSMWEQFHIGGIVDLLLAPLASGGQVISAGGFDAVRFFSTLEAARPTWFQGVPTTLRELCVHARRHGHDPRGSSLRFIRSVAAALPPVLMHEIEERFGVPVIQTFGMTEASPLITSTRLPPAQRKPGSAGSSCGPVVAILADDGHLRPTGQPGIVAVRGENIFSGYENDPAANAEAFIDGWFRTGDIGYLDSDGDLFLIGRVKEMINRGGEKISPQEVDDVLLKHPAVSQAATFARLHPTLGEDVAAAVVLRPGVAVDEQGLQDFARQRLVDFKIPRRVFFLDDLPRCPVGKVRRRDLAERFRDAPEATARAAPRHGLETTLAALWARELDVPEVGVDDDFAALGGDSLSSIRIVVATRALFGIEIPDGAAARFRTVRTMAQALVELGVPDSPPAHEAADRPTADGAGTIDGALAHADAVLSDENCTLSDSTDYATLAQFNLFMQARLGQATPADVLPLLHGNRPPASGFRGLIEAAHTLYDECRGTRPWTAIAITWERLRLRRNFARDLAQAREPLRWVRQRLGTHTDVYAAADGVRGRRTLIVGFAGVFQRLMLPAHSILCALDPEQVELMVVRSSGRNHYRDGIPGFGDTLEDSVLALDQYARRHGYRRIVSLGTSAGGLPAIIAALTNGWDRALAVGLDAVSNHRHLAEPLRRWHRARAEDGRCPVVVVAYAGRNRRDQRSGQEIKTLIPTALVLPDQRFDRHNLLHALHQQGELRPFLVDHLLGSA